MSSPQDEYFVWPNANQIRYAAVLGALKGLEPKQLFVMHQGKACEGEFPKVEFRFSPDYPDNTLLADNLMNQNQFIVASEKLRTFLADQNIPFVEYHAVQVLDHKGKKTLPYFIVHLLEPVDCLDREASGAIVRPTMKDQIMGVQQLRLLPKAIPADRSLFSIAGFARIRLVRAGLARAIEAAFEGIKFKPLAEVR